VVRAASGGVKQLVGMMGRLGNRIYDGIGARADRIGQGARQLTVENGHIHPARDKIRSRRPASAMRHGDMPSMCKKVIRYRMTYLSCSAYDESASSHPSPTGGCRPPQGAALLLGNIRPRTKRPTPRRRKRSEDKIVRARCECNS
jgi:hypothetical protein